MNQPSAKKLVIGSDHAGFAHKEELKKHLLGDGYELEDVGTDSGESVDYPDYALIVAAKVASGEYARGIIICGTGIGVCIAANKVKGIRAAACHDEFTARASRRHNDANILTMGARVLSVEEAIKVADAWLETDFEGGRHAARVDKITKAEES